jgi:hypothetical protein
VAERLPRDTAVARFNAWLDVKVTTGVGTIWCAYAFAVLAFVSLPSAISARGADVLTSWISWISWTYLQLALLSVIIVGQNVQAAADKRSEATYEDADAILHETPMIQEHMLAQDEVLSELIDKMARLEAQG